MNRQRLLLMIVGGIGAVLAGKTAVGLYQSALASRSADIRRFKTDLDKVKRAKSDSADKARELQKFGAQTLSKDPDEVISRLRDELYGLLKKTNLSKETVDMATSPQNWGKNGLRVLNCTVTAEGDMDKVTQFLYALFRRPYAVRVKSLTISQLTGKGVAPGALKMNAKLETLIFPANIKVDIKPVDLKIDKPVERTKLARLEDYRVLVDRKLWEPYVPPLPGKATDPNPARDVAGIDPVHVTLSWTAGANAKQHAVFVGENAPSSSIGTVTTTQMAQTGLKPGTRYVWRVDEIGEGGTMQGDLWSFTTKAPPQVPATQIAVKPQEQPQPHVEPPPPDANMVLVRVLSSPIKQQAVLMDENSARMLMTPAPNPQAANAPDKRVEVGESFFGGTLVYVDPRGGAVSERDGVLRFHPPMVPLSQAQPLTEQDQPELWHELKKLEAQELGIREQPG